MSIESTKLMNLSDGKVLYDDLRNRIESQSIYGKKDFTSVVSFSDGANNLPLEQIKIKIEPQQDLHGYNSVWFGGGGKNKLPLIPSETKQGVTLTVNSDGSVTFTGENTGGALYFDLFNANFNTTDFAGYILSLGDNANSNCAIRISDNSRANLQSCASEPITIADNGAARYIAFRIGNRYTLPEGGITLYPMLRAPNTDDTFEPYENICPITGWTSSNITLSSTLDAQDGTTYQVSFPVEAGTVYGGMLTVNRDGTGFLSVTHSTLSFSGEAAEEWEISGSPYKYARIAATGYKLPVNAISNELPYNGIGASNDTVGFSFLTSGDHNQLRIRHTLLESLTDTEFKAWLSANPLQIVYELETPIIYSLTTTQMNTILGLNNIWANTGDISLMYQKDIGANYILSNKADKSDTVLDTTLSRGRKANTTVGSGSIAFGVNCEASGNQCQAFGSGTVASSSWSHAEGYGTTASGDRAHAEGQDTTASGGFSHAEGRDTTASGSYSHAEGRNTVANHAYQHAAGFYNTPDPSTAEATSKGNYIEIIGNGTSSSNTSNARALDWNGNEYLKGDLFINCDNNSANGIGVSTAINTFVKASAATHTFTIANNSYHFIFAGSNHSNYYYLGYVFANSNGAVSANDIAKGSSITIDTATTNKFKIIPASARSMVVRDMCIYGDLMTE